jgi:hypothetical protein
LDVDAPGFRGSVLAGAVAAVLTIVSGEYLIRSRRHSRRELARLREQGRAQRLAETVRGSEAGGQEAANPEEAEH